MPVRRLPTICSFRKIINTVIEPGGFKDFLDIENLDHNGLLSVDDEVRMVYDPKLTNQENSSSCIAVVAQGICANRLTRRGGYAPPRKKLHC